MNTINSRSNKFTAKQKLLFLLCGIILPFLTLEIFLRVGGYILLTYREYGNKLQIEKKGNCVVLCLGDSITYKQYPHMLEKMLNEKSKSISFSVIDEGIPEANSTEIISKLNTNIQQYNPDIIIAMMGGIDAGEYLPYDRDNFLKHFRIYKLYKLIIAHASARYKDMPLVHMPVHYNKPEYEKNRQQLENEITELKSQVAKNPQDEYAYAMLGRAYFFNNQFDEARKLVDNANKLFSDALIVHGELAGYYLWLYPPKDERPVNYLRLLAQKNVRHLWIYKCLGDFYVRRGELEKAIEVYKKGAEITQDKRLMYDSLAFVYRSMGNKILAEKYSQSAKESRESCYNITTKQNYLELIHVAKSKGIKLICMQYPVRNLEPLVKMIGDSGEGVLFVSNENIFKDEVKQRGFWYYFVDSTSGDFGHCTIEGNTLIAENLANEILNKWFREDKKHG
jgi:tetratricopeptide (TPR) repeat protein